MYIGEGFAVGGINAAHINIMTGPRDGVVGQALENDINFIDLADFYSLSAGEEVVGRILKHIASRDELVLTTKVGYAIGRGANNQGHSRKHIMKSIDDSLKRRAPTMSTCICCTTSM